MRLPWGAALVATPDQQEFLNISNTGKGDDNSPN